MWIPRTRSPVSSSIVSTPARSATQRVEHDLGEGHRLVGMRCPASDQGCAQRREHAVGCEEARVVGVDEHDGRVYCGRARRQLRGRPVQAGRVPLLPALLEDQRPITFFRKRTVPKAALVREVRTGGRRARQRLPALDADQ